MGPCATQRQGCVGAFVVGGAGAGQAECGCTARGTRGPKPTPPSPPLANLLCLNIRGVCDWLPAGRTCQRREAFTPVHLPSAQAHLRRPEQRVLLASQRQQGWSGKAWGHPEEDGPRHWGLTFCLQVVSPGTRGRAQSQHFPAAWGQKVLHPHSPPSKSDRESQFGNVLLCRSPFPGVLVPSHLTESLQLCPLSLCQSLPTSTACGCHCPNCMEAFSKGGDRGSGE